MSNNSNDRDSNVIKRKSTAHHEMFNSSQTPWGVEKAQGSVPQIKRMSMDPEEMPAAGKKSIFNNRSDSLTKGGVMDASEQELQNQLS